jgi:2-phosphosulfolactate phosphatase
MNCDIIVSCEDIKEDIIKGKVVVVIDMLRATTVITTAVKNGCNEVIPVLSVEEANTLTEKYGGRCIRGGERRALRIEGFECSNSPLEYTENVVKDKTLIITTTNGTRAIKGSIHAKRIFIGSMINGRAVANILSELNEDVVFVNAGTYGQFSMDDFICSGYIIDCIMKLRKAELSDISVTAHHIYESHKDIVSFIKHARHYNVLMNLGLGKDLEYCCQKSITDVVPYYKDGIIRKFI